MEEKTKTIISNNTTGNLETVDTVTSGRSRTKVPYMVVLAGESVGRVVRFDANKVLLAGRARHCEIYFDCDNISREHARFEVDAEGNTRISDLQSTNGTLVNGKKVDTTILNDGDRICLGNVILRFSLKDDLEFDFQQDLYHKATKDPLTGVFNKRYFMEAFYKEFAHHKRHTKPLSLLLFDLDDFKRLNDTYGHVNGDIVLKSLAREIVSCLRDEDVFARFGGEEFVALFRYTGRDSAMVVARKLLELVRSMRFATPTLEFTVSATIGIATLEDGNFETIEDMLMHADQNLYLGKSQGKNRVVG